MERYYSQVFPAPGPDGNKGVAILDICSSWVSHYPEGLSAGRVAGKCCTSIHSKSHTLTLHVGLGMNEDELSRNKQLTEFSVKDLNLEPKLPYEVRAACDHKSVTMKVWP
jgi:hypothetical protein